LATGYNEGLFHVEFGTLVGIFCLVSASDEDGMGN